MNQAENNSHSSDAPLDSRHLTLIATCAFGLEAVVKRELSLLGYEARTLVPGRIEFHGELEAICRANIHLRCAERVLIKLGGFSARDFGELFDRTFELPWERWITPDGCFPVAARSRNSQLASLPACQRMVKKAIVERLRAAHRVAQLSETGSLFPVELTLLDDCATLTLDTTGEGLHKRGYRKLAGPAPLRETLAAALVLLSFWERGRPFLDPFCGSGTIPIEAARIGRAMAPGLERSFLAESWPHLSAATWQEIRQQARAAVLPALPVRLVATDVDSKALKMARQHALAAGVADDIHFQLRDFANLTSHQKFGCLISNPPYGKRLGDSKATAALYRSFPQVLRRLPTWSHFILTAQPDFERIIGQEADRRRKLYNGRIECQFYQFHGPHPDRAGDLRQSFGGLADKADRQAQEFASRLAKRARHLRRWPGRGITCYRLYDQDIPEVPLVVDRYGDCLHICDFARPHDRTPAQQADWVELMAQTASKVTDVDPSKVFVKRHQRQRGGFQYPRLAQDEHMVEVREGGLRFLVNLSDYVDTGLFLDHRLTRARVRDEAGGKRVLNLFGYTGSFTVYAAAGGARSTTTVDLSKSHLQWAEMNLRLNKLDGAMHRFIRADALVYLRGLDRDVVFDLAIVDAPTFSNSKSTAEYWDIQRDHVPLLQLLARHVAPGGVIYFATNLRRFKLCESGLVGLQIRDISSQTIPPDFRDRRVHRCWRMVVG